ncbi:transglutaminase family protein [Sphingomonas sp. FW199]|uniref:transglutaminase family protein n=1 Tax=Sphingomonas sp. FW199 TaxID=3400217 RepID=UPI003CEA630A
MRLRIDHVTTYAYRTPVELLAHRMMLSPRSSSALHPIASDLSCDPKAELSWTQDVFGNLIATASFREPADRLTITNRVIVEQAADPWPILAIAPHAHSFPFDYSSDERTDLGALLVPEYPDPGARLARWARAQMLGDRTDTLSLLKDINAAARIGMTYVTREEVGTQSPHLTLDLGSGSCRDLATLFIDAVRHLGFGARAVSGYLFDPPTLGEAANPRGQHGSTHAWAEVYLPCAGWVAFDPTNGRMGEAHLVPVAVGRGIRRLSPVEGRYVGAPDAVLSMTVQVMVSVDPADLSSKDGTWNPD